MTSVEKVLAVLKERHIAVSRMERDLGFGNGYIKQLRKGSVPADRLSAIAKYLDVPLETLLSGESEKAAIQKDDGIEELIRLYLSAPAWIQDQARSLLEAGASSLGTRPSNDSKD